MKNFLYLSLCVISLCLVGIAAVDSKTEPLEIEKFPGERGYGVFPIPLDELGKITLAGEVVPTHLIDIYERLEREMLVNTYWQSNGLLLMNRMNRYFPIIEPILKKNNIPDDFKY
ncbi:MAG: membrane-bound lytic murein transglycosylase D, partial [Sphingobacteriales bacterium]